MMMVAPNTLEITAMKVQTQSSLHLEFSHTSLQINRLAISLSQNRKKYKKLVTIGEDG